VAFAARKLGPLLKWTSDRWRTLRDPKVFANIVRRAEMGLDTTARCHGSRCLMWSATWARTRSNPWTAALEPVQVVSFWAGPLSHQNYPRQGTGGRHPPKRRLGSYAGSAVSISTFGTDRLLRHWPLLSGG